MPTFILPMTRLGLNSWAMGITILRNACIYSASPIPQVFQGMLMFLRCRREGERESVCVRAKDGTYTTNGSTPSQHLCLKCCVGIVFHFFNRLPPLSRSIANIIIIGASPMRVKVGIFISM